MTYLELLQYLKDIGEVKYAGFVKKIANSDYECLGIRSPMMKQIIKGHAKDADLVLDEFVLGKYLEVDNIYFGIALVRAKTCQEQLKFLEKKIRYARSWAVTDSATPYIKKISFEDYWKFFLKLNDSKHLYERRIAYVLGLKLYKDERILQVLPYIQSDEDYMVMMAEAWLMATIAICYPNEVFSYLESLSDIVLKRKTISKICDSFRFDEATKEKFKSLRK